MTLELQVRSLIDIYEWVVYHLLTDDLNSPEKWQKFYFGSNKRSIEYDWFESEVRSYGTT